MKKTFWFSILSILMVMVLSGCLDYNIDIYHHVDGSGNIRFEFIFLEDLLDRGDEITSWEEAREELMALVAMDDELSTDSPNIRSVSSEDFVNPQTNAWHYVYDIEFYDILSTQEDFDEEWFLIEANPDGTYRFIWDFGPSEEDEGSDFFEEDRDLLEKTYVRIKLHVSDFIEGDSRAVYDPNEKVVTWEIPNDELVFNPQTYYFWAVYRVDAPEMIDEEPEIEVPAPIIVEDVAKPASPEVPLPPPAVVQPQQDDGFLGLPNWVPFVLAGLCCLSLVAVVVVILVVVVLKKRKNPAPPPRSY